MTDRLVAEFAGADEARAAVVALERHGVDADAIELAGFDDPRVEATRQAEDRRMATTAVRRAAGGALVGVVVGAVVGVLGALLAGADQAAVYVAAALGAGAFVGALGAFWSVGAGLPVTEGGFEAEGDGPVCVVVDVDDDRIRSVLDDHGARLRA